MSLTTFKIDGVDVLFDPDTLDIQSTNVISIKKSMAGTSYVTHYETAAGGDDASINIGGVYLPQTVAQSLYNKRKKKIPIVLAGGVVGCSGTYIIRNIQVRPIKPGVALTSSVISGDAETTIKYQYSLSLTEVD
jgi:hypothetical protein